MEPYRYSDWCLCLDLFAYDIVISFVIDFISATMCKYLKTYSHWQTKRHMHMMKVAQERAARIFFFTIVRSS